MNKPYYDCPIKAAYMAKYFGMTFDYYASSKNVNVIDSVSLLLLEAQVKDLLWSPSVEKYYCAASLEDFPDVNDFQIIQRNGIPFMWPKEEA